MPANHTEAGILLLAAGASRRFGSDKRLAQLPSGSSVLEASVALYQSCGLPLRVCIRPDDESIAELLDSLQVETIVCRAAQAGMGQTIADGVAAMPPWKAVLIALADMPFIQPGTVRKLADELMEDAICLPVYEGRTGHPVGFGRRFYPELKKLSLDSGARSIVQGNTNAVATIEVNDGGILQDIDQPQDLVCQADTRFS
jgi:molybdenum cofactor cytidylyltransferase